MTLPAARGLFVPITTPFLASGGGVDDAALTANVRRLLEQGVGGIVVCGSTGEAALLSPSEQARVVELARAVIPDDRWLVAGTGAESTRATIELTREAARAGTDAVMLRPPAYYGPTLGATAIARHFRAVADASPVPVFLYNIPKYTHFALDPETVAALADHPQILGLKDSGGDMERFASYRAAAPSWTVFVGSLGHVIAAVEQGAVGGILAAGCFLAEAINRLFAALSRGERDVAQRLQQTLTPVAREIVGRLGVPGVKCAMDILGWAGGAPRPPLEPLDADGRDHVAAILGAID